MILPGESDRAVWILFFYLFTTCWPLFIWGDVCGRPEVIPNMVEL